MPSIHGEFAIHRTKTPDGRDAILLVPEKSHAPLTYSFNDESDESGEISFGLVADGEFPGDEYVTITFEGENRVHFGPYRKGYIS